MNANFIVAKALELPEDLKNTINVADEKLGAQVVFATDEFFAPKERMLNPEPAKFYPNVYDDHGKWMDGWETRRRRNTGHDWCDIQLAFAAKISAVNIDTSFFTGNFPPAASLQACYCPNQTPQESDWENLIEHVTLKGDSHHVVYVEQSDKVYTHLRLHIWPDGGVARLKVFGVPFIDWQNKPKDTIYNLIAAENGGRQIAWSDAHYGEPQNMLRQGRGVDMGDGWETKRRREPGNEWCIIALGHVGKIQKIEIDTAHFKGNFPAQMSIQAALEVNTPEHALVTKSMFWPTLIAPQNLTADAIHEYIVEIQKLGAISHIRLNSIPDGGISRVRLWGVIT